jgi:hypothetical protein
MGVLESTLSDNYDIQPFDILKIRNTFDLSKYFKDKI